MNFFVDELTPSFRSHRYCHLYREGELAELVASVPGLVVDSVEYDTSNWCVIAHKVGER